MELRRAAPRFQLATRPLRHRYRKEVEIQFLPRALASARKNTIEVASYETGERVGQPIAAESLGPSSGYRIPKRGRRGIVYHVTGEPLTVVELSAVTNERGQSLLRGYFSHCF